MDAYDGSMTFYVADPSDPIIRAWEGVFPALFHPLSELPADLRAHLRVPEDLFNVQTDMFGRYHVTDPETFFREDDRWTVPTGQTNEQSLPSEAYYVIMRMPGEADPEFLLLQPMVPTSRPNMIAWVAARNDPEHYGGVRVYRFPTDTSVFGPAQIEARIDQDPTISAQVTLWNQSGSKVVRGNLIVVPDRGHPHLPPARLSPVHVVVLPGVPADRRRVADLGRLGADARRGAQPAARGRRQPGADARPRRRGRRPARAPTPAATPGTDLPADVAGPDRLRERPLRGCPGDPARR